MSGLLDHVENKTLYQRRTKAKLRNQEEKEYNNFVVSMFGQQTRKLLSSPTFANFVMLVYLTSKIYLVHLEPKARLLHAL